MIKSAGPSDLMPFIASHTDSEFGVDFDATFDAYSILPDYKTNFLPQVYDHIRSHSPSISSASGLSTPSFPASEYSKSDYAMSYHGDEENQPFYYTPATESTLYPTSTASAMEMSSYGYAENYSQLQHEPWSTPSLYAQQQDFSSYPELPSSAYQAPEMPPSTTSTNLIPPTPQSPMPATAFDFNNAAQPSYLSPLMSHPRSRETSTHSISRSTSPASNLSSTPSAASLQAYGTLVVSNSHAHPTTPPTWRCAFPGCTSRALFTRGCDLRKHYNRHSKHLFCRIEGCPQSEHKSGASGSVGFSSKKDRARHEAKHNPGIPCEWRDASGEGCGRVFSRVDNMKDHVRRIHCKGNR